MNKRKSRPNLWPVYEARKREIERTAQSAEEYEKKIRELLKELKL